MILLSSFPWHLASVPASGSKARPKLKSQELSDDERQRRRIEREAAASRRIESDTKVRTRLRILCCYS